MALLLHEQLKAAMQAEKIEDRLIVTPLLDPKQIGPGSIDLRLGTEFIEVERHTEAVIDPYRQQEGLPPSAGVTRFVPLGDRIALHPDSLSWVPRWNSSACPRGWVPRCFRAAPGTARPLGRHGGRGPTGFRRMSHPGIGNTGSVSIQLRRGLRVAQLQVWSGESVRETYSSGGGKYQAPLGPESNKLAWESQELERLQVIDKHLLGRQ